MIRFVPTFRGRRHSENTRFKLSLIRRGKSYEQIFGPHVAAYLKEQRRQQVLAQPKNPNFTFAGWSHSDTSKAKMRAAAKQRNKRQR